MVPTLMFEHLIMLRYRSAMDADPECTSCLFDIREAWGTEWYLCKAAVETAVFILIRRNAPRITLP